jgi:hypothetical protein
VIVAVAAIVIATLIDHGHDQGKPRSNLCRRGAEVTSNDDRDALAA